ncbi:hypothetical protein [Streptomyces sp. NPDC002602]|uniref:hypothetical protein n=1 Tax=Streptomyces sp. NPDC002602 TaxID=3364654 RepID=UPI0036A822B2
MWTGYRNGSRLIAGDLLDTVVDRLITEPQMRERQRKLGHHLLAEAKMGETAGAAKTVRSPHPSHNDSPLTTVLMRLDDARLQQIEAMRQLATSEKRCAALEDAVSALQERCIELEVQRDNARELVRAELERELSQFRQYRRDAHHLLERARRAAGEAYGLRLAAEEKVARAKTAAHDITDEAISSSNLSAVAAEPPFLSGDQVTDLLRRAEEQLAEQDHELDALREGIVATGETASPGQPSPRTSVVVARPGDALDNPNNAATRADTQDNSVFDTDWPSVRRRLTDRVRRDLPFFANFAVLVVLMMFGEAYAYLRMEPQTFSALDQVLMICVLVVASILASLSFVALRRRPLKTAFTFRILPFYLLIPVLGWILGAHTQASLWGGWIASFFSPSYG